VRGGPTRGDPIRGRPDGGPGFVDIWRSRCIGPHTA
jgi:hypothetical protein